MAREKIVGVITHNDQGGAQEALYRLCSALSDRGHSVSLWYLYKKRPLPRTDLPTKVVLETAQPSAIDYLRITSRLWWMLAQTRPAAVISFLPLANVLAQTLAWTCRVPIRIASQRNPVQTYSGPMQMLDWYFGTSGSYTHNVVNSSDVRLSVQGYPWPYQYRTQTILNGVAPFPICDVARSKARSMFQLAPDDLALVSIGRLTKQKNHMFLIQILGALKKVKLLLAGSGPEQAKLALEAERMGIGNRVHFLGSLHRGDTELLLQAADIFALPSLYEGHSNALLEAMSAGKPIVASDIPSNRETLTDGHRQAGIVIPTTEPKQWIDTLNELTGSIEKRRALGKSAQDRAAIFSIDAMCSGFERLIKPRSSSVARSTIKAA